MDSVSPLMSIDSLLTKDSRSCTLWWVLVVLSARWAPRSVIAVA